MLTLDPVLSGVPVSAFVDATTAELTSPTPTMLADVSVVYRETTAPYRWYRSNGSILIELGSGTPGTVTGIVYSGGNTTAATINGVAFTYTYDVDGNVQTITGGGVTRTVSYNGDGTIASIT